jgi:hypothetical protein
VPKKVWQRALVLSLRFCAEGNLQLTLASEVLKMAKAQKILGLFLFFVLIVSIAPANSEEGTKARLFLKSGKIVECDRAWIASKDIVRCKEGSGTTLDSIGGTVFNNVSGRGGYKR